MSDTGKRTLVEEGTTFKGSLTSSCPVLVKGAIEGDLTTPSLTVASSGSVSGKVKADELKSDGEISGDFDVEKVTLSGTVKDNTVIKAQTFEVKLSVPGGKMQVVFGECQLEVGEAPTREKQETKTNGGNGKSVPPPAADEA